MRPAAAGVGSRRENPPQRAYQMGAMRCQGRQSDFVTSTGEAKVPWAAVGEHASLDDVMELIEFLVPPRHDAEVAYDVRISEVREAVAELLVAAGLRRS